MVVSTVRNGKAGAALTTNGSVFTWGNSGAGGDCSKVRHQLIDVQHISSNDKAFAAVKSDGSIVAWGEAEAQTKLDGVAKTIIENGRGSATAALKTDGSVVTWGNISEGGDSRKVQAQLARDVQHIYASEKAFAALKTDRVIVWGGPQT